MRPARDREPAVVVAVLPSTPDAVLVEAAVLARPFGAPDAAAAEARVATVLEGVPWELRSLAGEPADALIRLAAEVDATMFVVGARPRGAAATIRAFFGGSVAVHLAHRQSRPVVVVPTDPAGDDGDLPWNAS